MTDDGQLKHMHKVDINVGVHENSTEEEEEILRDLYGDAVEGIYEGPGEE